MPDLRRPFVSLFVAALLLGAMWPALASDQVFPFDRELMFDAAPMHGSKRVPIIEIDSNGAASIDLWCNSLRGQASVGAGSITIVPGPAAAAQCPAERQLRDASLLAALTQVTAWRRRGDVVELIGATTLRFRLMTN